MMCAVGAGTLALALAVTSSLSHPRAAHAWGSLGASLITALSGMHLSLDVMPGIEGAADTDQRSVEPGCEAELDPKPSFATGEVGEAAFKGGTQSYLIFQSRRHEGLR